MSYRFLLFTTLIALGACSYTMDEHIQDLRIVTPGAHGAVCYAYVDKLKYKFRPPQTLNISKSDEDLIVDCLAPGNRRKEVVIKAQIEQSVYANALTAGAGAVWDYSSGAMFKYPDVVEVNFENMPSRAEDLPAQNKPDIKQPEEYVLEEFKPGSPRMNADRYQQESEILRREKPGAGDGSLSSGYRASDGEIVPSQGNSMDKGDLMNVIESVGPDAMNPAAPAIDNSNDQYGPPIPLYPGQ